MVQEAYIFLNGEYSSSEPLAEIARNKEMIIGVDGGTQFLLSLNIIPQIVIGDMDSLASTRLKSAESAGAKVLRYSPEKDETDFELALEYAIRHGCNSILVYGGLGGRLDQMLANILLPVRLVNKASICLIHGMDRISYITRQAKISGKAGDGLSLIPLSNDVTGVKTTGLRYPLSMETLYLGKSRGVSNKMTSDEASISVVSGVLLCIHMPIQEPPGTKRSQCE